MRAGDPWWTNLRTGPDRERAIARYSRLAAGYEATTTHIRAVRARLVELLDPQPGECVLDIACGAGAMLPALAQRVGRTGRVIGVELSPAMAVQARAAAAQGPPGAAPIEVSESSVEDFRLGVPADAAVLCYTHDVLQSRAAVASLVRALRPGARLVVAGMCTVSWTWGAPLNVWMLWRARRYLTTWRGLARPWRLLEDAGAEVCVVQRHHAGTGYVARGRTGPRLGVRGRSCGE